MLNKLFKLKSKLTRQGVIANSGQMSGGVTATGGEFWVHHTEAFLLCFNPKLLIMLLDCIVLTKFGIYCNFSSNWIYVLPVWENCLMYSICNRSKTFLLVSPALPMVLTSHILHNKVTQQHFFSKFSHINQIIIQ